MAIANIVLVILSIFAALWIALWQFKKHNEERAADEQRRIEEKATEEFKSQISVILFDLYNLNHLYADMLRLGDRQTQERFQLDHMNEFQNNNISIINNLVRATRLSKADAKLIYEAIGSAKYPRYEQRIDAIQEVITMLEPIVNPHIAEVFREVAVENQQILNNPNRNNPPQT